MTGNVAFMFVCTIMVFFMTPGLAFFYGGMVRRKNALNTMMFCMAMMGIGMLLWFLCGYSLSFGKDHAGIIGDLNNVLMRNVSWEVTGGEGDAPEMVSALFNMMFAVISPAIILEPCRTHEIFQNVLFVVIWSVPGILPAAHMAWGGGLLEMIGSIDFAGGNVIHISTGVSGLTACIILGSRKGYGAMSYHPHNIPLFLLGASMLWMGWFCFNCGCAGGANSIAVLAFANTALSSAASMVVWMLIEALVQKKCTVMGAVTGGIVGLVGITPGAGYVPLWSSLIIGATAAPICYLAISKMKKKFGYDDALDAFGCHGVGGIWGGIVTGIFATKQMNDAVPQEGLLFGDYRLFLSQLGAIGISIAVAVVMTTYYHAGTEKVQRCAGIRSGRSTGPGSDRTR